ASRWAPAVTQPAPAFKATAVHNGEGLFIIDPNGVVRHMSVNDLPVGRCVDETLRLVRAFQFVETHGEVCPASWTPDSPTIKPTPHGSKEYFEKVN
uniref:thioredoxin-dependent peroxiredoxin n=1 Tax=Oryzias melastigma TaxID=30732 RepID=A0A3B3CAI3_ORYME